MDRWRTARACTGGGVVISTFSADSARLTTRAAALLVASALATALAVRAGAGFEVLMTVGGCAVVSLVCGVFFGWSAGIAWSAGLLGLEYVLSLFVGGAALDLSAPLVGAGLMLTTELGYWSIELRAPIRDDVAVHQARARVIGALVAGGVLVAAVPLLVAQLAPGGALLTMIGVVAAIGVLSMLVVLGWRAARASGSAAG